MISPWLEAWQKGILGSFEEMKKQQRCPVMETAEIIAGKWTLLIIRDLAGGRCRVCELERSLDGISPRTLSLRLRALEAERIIQRRTYAEVPPRVEFSLTDYGCTLRPVTEAMCQWGKTRMAAGAA